MTKLTALTELTAVDPADLLYIVDDPAGTPTGKKATALNVVSDTLANAGVVVDFSNGLTIAGGSNGINSSGALTAAGATFDNNADSTFDINFDSGSTTAQFTRLNFKDRGTTQFSIVKDNTGLFSLYDNTNGTPVFYGDSTGITIGSYTRDAKLHIVNGTASQPAFIAQAAAGQSANRFESRDANGNADFYQTASGNLSFRAASTNRTFSIAAYSTTTSDKPFIAFTRSRSATLGTNATTSASDHIGGAYFYGVDAANAPQPGGALLVTQDGASGTGSGSVKMHLRFYAADGSALREGFRVDGNTTANETPLVIYDITGAALVRVSIGAADSGGSGYRVLRIPN